MTNTSSRNYFYLILISIVSCLVYLGVEYHYTNGQMGVPLDDTWIHFRFADNFAHGNFFQYNVNEPTAGTTSPLYVIVLGTAGLLISNFIISSLLISFTFYLLTVIFVYKISLLIFSKDNNASVQQYAKYYSAEFIALIIASITVISGRLVWSALSGMETTMFTFFSIAGIYFHIKNLNRNKFSYMPAIFFSLAVVSRPEGFLLFSIFLFDVLYNGIKEKNIKSLWLKVFISIVIFLAVSLPYLIFSYNLSGHFFPNTFRGQGGGFKYIPDFNYLRIVMVLFLRDNIITGILYLAGFFYYIFNLKKYSSEFRLLNLMLLWIFLMPLVSSVLIPNWRHHVRYMIPLIPLINVAAIYFMFRFFDMKRLINFKKYLFRKRLLTTVLLICSMVYYIVYAIALGKNTQNINDQQVLLADWVGKNVAKDETIGLNDIGAITFKNGNRIVDMAGLVTPEVLRYYSYNVEDRLDSMNYLLKKNNVSYIIIYDHWFTEYLNKYGNELTFLTSAVLKDNTICGGDTMKVYKTNFNK